MQDLFKSAKPHRLHISPHGPLLAISLD